MLVQLTVQRMHMCLERVRGTVNSTKDAHMFGGKYEVQSVVQ